MLLPTIVSKTVDKPILHQSVSSAIVQQSNDFNDSITPVSDIYLHSLPCILIHVVLAGAPSQGWNPNEGRGNMQQQPPPPQIRGPSPSHYGQQEPNPSQSSPLVSEPRVSLAEDLVLNKYAI